MNLENITLQDLVTDGRISTRTANCCRALRLQSLADIIGYADQHGFTGVKGCGAKSQFELYNLVADVHDRPESFMLHPSMPGIDELPTEVLSDFIPDPLKERFARVFERTVAEHFPNDSDTYLAIYPDVVALASKTRRKVESMFIADTSLGFNSLMRIWDCTHAIFTQLELICIDADDPLQDHFSIRTREYARTREYHRYLLAKACMDSRHLALVDAEYKRVLGTLSVRSRNVLTSNRIDEPTLMSYILTNTIDRLNLNHCGRKSLNEINAAFHDFSKKVSDILNVSAAEINLRHTNQLYPFLTPAQAQRYIHLKEQSGHAPVFYLLYHYFLAKILSSPGETTPEKIYANYYGIGLKDADRNELSDIYNLSAERIRQILVGFAPDSLLRLAGINEAAAVYPEYRENGLYVDAIGLTRHLRDNELADAELYGDTALAGLVILTGNYNIVSRTGLTFCVDKSLCEQFQFSKALIAAEIHCSHRHEKDDLFDVDQWCERFATPGATVTAPIRNCFVDMILSYLPVYERDGEIYIRQNYIRVAREAYIIIKEHGAPMSLADLYTAFKAKFPEHKFDDAESLRCHLHQNNGFRAIGKQSTYSLDIWDFNTDSNTALIYRILSESPVPLHSTEIVARLKDYGRETTPMLVVNFIYMDKKRDFKHFRNSYFGVADRQYPPEYEALDPDRLRVLTFDERLANLADFLDTHHYRPRSNNDADEASLYRWVDNVLNGKINLTPVQQAAFNDFIEARREDFITWADYDFREHCRRLADFVAATGEMPTAKTDPDLFRWYKRTAADHAAGKLPPFRRQHFSTLLLEKREERREKR